MKHLITILLFLTPLLVQSQSIEVVYTTKLLDFEIQDNFQNQLYKKAKNAASNYGYALKVANEQSLCTPIKPEKDGYDINLSLLGINPNIVFHDKVKNIKLEKVKNENNLVIKSNYNNWEWTLKNETKEIEHYTCYKAIGEKEITRKGKKERISIIAWYCPEINYSFGPNDVVGLPGLVFEVIRGKQQHIVKKIAFANNSFEIVKPTGKIISKEEYLKKLKENSPF